MDNLQFRKKKLSLAEIVTLGIFRFFTGHSNWKNFYRHIKTYHKADFPNLPSYGKFVESRNKVSFFAVLLLRFFQKVFQEITPKHEPKFIDSACLPVYGIKREFSHKVCKGLAKKSKSTMGWFYGFKLHAICNELMQILEF